jgi:hypothetical protein
MRTALLKATLVGAGVVVIAMSPFCGAILRHVAPMADMAGDCGARYSLTVLPQTGSGKDVLSTLLCLAVFLIAYLFVKILDKSMTKPAVNSAHEIATGKSVQTISNPLLELFRRGILNPKIFEAAYFRI